MGADREQQCVEAFTPFIERCATTLHCRLPPGHPATVPDLKQDGVLGLIEALRESQLNGAEFERAAHARIRWRMIDGVHRMSLIPRRAYRAGMRQARGEGEARAEGPQDIGRAPLRRRRSGGLRARSMGAGAICCSYSTRSNARRPMSRARFRSHRGAWCRSARTASSAYGACSLIAKKVNRCN
ncbi:MAG: hypothetical protein ACREV4_02335 [Gammaproteobacteria bacterium]